MRYSVQSSLYWLLAACYLCLACRPIHVCCCFFQSHQESLYSTIPCSLYQLKSVIFSISALRNLCIETTLSTQRRTIRHFTRNTLHTAIRCAGGGISWKQDVDHSSSLYQFALLGKDLGSSLEVSARRTVQTYLVRESGK